MLLLRLVRIFFRYAEIHLSLTGRGQVLRDAAGDVVGHLDVYAVRAGRLILEGRSAASRFGLRLGGVDHWVKPVPVPGGAMGEVRFDMPYMTGDFALLSSSAGAVDVHPVAGFSRARLRLARLGLAVRFVWTLCTLLPEIWRWKRGGDLGARETVKEVLGLVFRPPAGLIDAQVLEGSPAPAGTAPDRLTIVVPVYNAFDMLQEALDRVVRHTDLPWRMVLIEDASPDAQVRPWLADWARAQGDRVVLLENAQNLGFVGSVNRGLETAQNWPNDPVVLLNTDAMVPAGWAARLLAPLADPATASVTPFSNDAEIFTAPVLCARHDLAPGTADALDAAARDLAPGEIRPEAPTGVGFCMALAPRFLQQVPQLDTAFGRGYGEETDWCQKTRALGGRHVCAQNLFVEHRGGASFGSVTKQKLLQRSAAEISRRYPRFDSDVAAFLQADPLTTPRLALALSAAALGGEVPVYLAHAMGGGAENWLEQRIAAHIADGRSAVVLRVGQGVRWRLEVHGAQGITAGLSDDLDTVAILIDRLTQRRILYSCGVGHPEAHLLPDVLLRLSGGTHPIELLVHDFFVISPSYTLLGQDGHFVGAPDPQDPAHQFQTPDGALVPLAAWQASWGRLIDAATRVVVFSNDSRAHVIAAYPQAAAKVAVIPHALPYPVPRIPQRAAGPDTPRVIGVLGNIGPHKGAAVLQRLSRDLAGQGRDAARVVIIGHLAPEFRLSAPSQVHGTYWIEDLPDLVARYGITGWFIPSIWPETFSYTTHEALATGLPVVAFDLGAQGDAVRAAPNGAVLDLAAQDAPDLAAQLVQAVRGEAA